MPLSGRLRDGRSAALLDAQLADQRFDGRFLVQVDEDHVLEDDHQ
jgi:hypothetical protein